MKYVCIAIVSLLLDSLLGDSSRIPHPVVWMGKGIQFLEKNLRKRLPDTPRGEIIGGGLMACILAGGTLALSGGILHFMYRVHPVCFYAVSILWGWQCLAMRGLRDESSNVQKYLERGTLEEARKQVGRIVGRDTDALTGAGVIRAAVETVAENFSDGVIAPLLYLVIGGAPLSLCYKAINTMDSMVGYKNDVYLYFGKIPARMDDLANYVPSRISAFLLMAAALFCGEDAGGALKIWKRDRRSHTSPNAGQTEAAMAGALGIWLGGPASYFGVLHEKPYIGDAAREPESADIQRVNRLMYTGSLLGLVIFCLLRMFLFR